MFVGLVHVGQNIMFEGQWGRILISQSSGCISSGYNKFVGSLDNIWAYTGEVNAGFRKVLSGGEIIVDAAIVKHQNFHQVNGLERCREGIYELNIAIMRRPANWDVGIEMVIREGKEVCWVEVVNLSNKKWCCKVQSLNKMYLCAL
jgi:hypothetical protein